MANALNPESIRQLIGDLEGQIEHAQKQKEHLEAVLRLQEGGRRPRGRPKGVTSGPRKRSGPTLREAIVAELKKANGHGKKSERPAL